MRYLTSDIGRRRGLTLLLFWRECVNPGLPKCVYVCANQSWSSFIYRRNEYNVFFMNLCKSPFLKMCYLASFAAEVYSLLGREGRGQQSSLAFKATWTKKWLAENWADFDRVKKVFFYTKQSMWLFIKTLNNHINLWKLCIRWPL